MTDPTELEKTQYQRLKQIFGIGRQRYLDAGGDPRRSAGSLNGQDHLTDEEKREVVELGQQVFSRDAVKVKNRPSGV